MAKLMDIIAKWELVSQPFITDASSAADDCISRDTLVECADRFDRDSIPLDDLLEEMQGHLSSYIHSGGYPYDCYHDFIRDPPEFVSTEYYWLLWMNAKLLKGDWDYCFFPDESQGSLFSRDHRMFELGPMDGSIYAEEGLLSTTFKTALSVFKGMMVRRFQERLASDDILRANLSSKGISLEGASESYAAKEEDRLFALINSFIADPRYHQTPDRLVSPGIQYNVRFATNFYDFLRICSGDESILNQVGRQNIPPIIKKMGLVSPIDSCYKIVSFFSNKYNKLIETKAEVVGNNVALVRVAPTDKLKSAAGDYLQRVLDNSFQISRNIMLMIPDDVYGLKHKPLIESASCTKGIVKCSEEKIPPGLDGLYRQEILNRTVMPGFGEFIYQWEGGPTGWMRWFDPTDHGRTGILPTTEDWDAGKIAFFKKLAKLGLSMTPYGAKVAMDGMIHLRKVLEVSGTDYERQATTAAEQAAEHRGMTSREASGVLYDLGVRYQEYLYHMEEGNAADAKASIAALQELVREYLSYAGLQSDRQIGESEFEEKIRGVRLFLSVSDIARGVDPLQGKWHNKVFRVQSDAAQTSLQSSESSGSPRPSQPPASHFLKQFNVREMDVSRDTVRAEFLMYKWLSKTSLENRLRFPAPEVLGYTEIAVRDDITGDVRFKPVLVMEDIEGLNVYDFFDMLNKRVSPGDGESVAGLKDAILRETIERYCFIAKEYRSELPYSLGHAVREFRKTQDIKRENYAEKFREVFEKYMPPTDENSRGCVGVIADMLGKHLDGLEEVPLFDMAPRNNSIHIRNLYAKLLTTCRGTDILNAEREAVAYSLEETVDRSLDEILLNTGDPKKRGLICSACSSYDVLKVVDFENIRRDTFEFDDASHMIDSPTYNSSADPVKRAGLNVFYIAQRFLPEDSVSESETKSQVLGLLDRGEIEAAVIRLRSLIDYDGLESSRALVSVYRSIRWVLFYHSEKWGAGYEEPDVDKKISFHKAVALQEIEAYLALKRKDDPGRPQVSLDTSPDELSGMGLSAGMGYLKQYLLSIEERKDER